jgi:hypothetical protein
MPGDNTLRLFSRQFYFMKVGFSKTFPHLVNGTWEKNWLEEDLTTQLDWINLSDEDISKVIANVRKLQYALKKQVESFHFESNKADEKKAEKITEETKPGNIVDAINSCKELKVLEGYRLIVKGKPEFEKVYNNRLKELT